MSDASFRAVLNRKGWFLRPQVRLLGDLVAAMPTYTVVGEMEPLRIRPAEARADSTILGKVPLCTHVIYVQPRAVRVGDRVAVVERALGLASGAEAEASVLVLDGGEGLEEGASLQLRAGGEVEDVIVAEVAGPVVRVTPELRHGHAAGEAVWVVRAYEIGGVFDEAGQGHHLRLAVTEVG